MQETMPESAEITQVLHAIGRSEEGAPEKLLPLVYAELRRLAAARMAHELSGQTLQPTALVHEAWLRLVKDGDRTRQNRAHFFGAAGRSNRRWRERRRDDERISSQHTVERAALPQRPVSPALVTDQLLPLLGRRALGRIWPRDLPPTRGNLGV